MWRGLALVSPALVAVASAAGPVAGPAPRVRACVTLSETWNGAKSNHLPTSLFVEFARLAPASPHFQWAGAQAKDCRTRNGSHVNFHVVHGGALVSAGGTAAHAPRVARATFGGGTADVLIVRRGLCAGGAVARAADGDSLPGPAGCRVRGACPRSRGRRIREHRPPLAPRRRNEAGGGGRLRRLRVPLQYGLLPRDEPHVAAPMGDGGGGLPSEARGVAQVQGLYPQRQVLGPGRPRQRLRPPRRGRAPRCHAGVGLHGGAAGPQLGGLSDLGGHVRASIPLSPWATRPRQRGSAASRTRRSGHPRDGALHLGQEPEEAWPEVLRRGGRDRAAHGARRSASGATPSSRATCLEARRRRAREGDRRPRRERDGPGAFVVGAGNGPPVARLDANGAGAAPALTASWRAAAKVDESSGAPSVHIVRDPLDHVSELARSIDAAVYSFAGRFCPRVAAAHAAVEASVPSGDGKALRLALAATYYLDWNALAARAAPHARLRLEDFDEYALFAALGVERRTTWPLRRTWASLEAERAAADPGAQLSWGDVRAAIGDALCDELEAAAASYGYRRRDANHE